MKVKISLRFVSFLDILDIPLSCIPYILFKLEEIKKSGPNLCENIPQRLFRHIWLSLFFTLIIKSISILPLYQRAKIYQKSNIGGT